jgi:hypothetical protein
MARKPRSKPATETRGERNCHWIQTHCRIPEGRDVGKPVRLRDWQKRDICKIYDNPYGTRTAILSFGKKNAKTSTSAFLLLLHTAGHEAIPNTQLVSTAQSRDQAAVLFDLAAKIVRLSPTLSPVITIRDTAKQLHCPELGTLYKALSADSTTAHGKSPALAIHDELGQVRGPVSTLFNAVENAMGAHDNPLSVIISTQAPTDADLLVEVLIDDALAGHDKRVVISLYTAPLELDPFSDEAIRAANAQDRYVDDWLRGIERGIATATGIRVTVPEALTSRHRGVRPGAIGGSRQGPAGLKRSAPTPALSPPPITAVRLLKFGPSPWLSSYPLAQGAVHGAMAQGNHYSRVWRSEGGQIEQITPIQTGRCVRPLGRRRRAVLRCHGRRPVPSAG